LGKPILDELNERPHCKEFRRHKRGFSPDEHIKRLLEAEQSTTQFRRQIIAGIMTAFLAACLTLLGEFVKDWLRSKSPSAAGVGNTPAQKK
jgi:hypothetical protein